MKRVLIVALLLCAAAPLTAQTVRADRILIDDEFVPRFLDLPRVKAIARGEVWEAPEDSTWDYIEVQDGGVLSISRSHNTTLRFTHLFVLPGGRLNAGTEDSCIPPDIHVEFIVRDVPIDTKRDPFQWGNGLLNFGTQDRCGAAKRAWTTLTGSVLAGATAITLAEDPDGWRVGDELLIPDMLPTMRREATVSVAAIAGRQITLSKPLDFDRRDIIRPDGQLLLHPRVANLTRNFVIRSEGQTTPGHTADVGHMAMWHVAYNEINGLGRTKNVPLDNTKPDLSHIGTNQIARYADHYHHAMGLNSYTRGSVLRGATGKWGLVVHATHDAVIDRNIAIGFHGAGFTTEDGYETRNTFSYNFAAYNIGNHTGDGNMEVSNDNVQNPGASGNGFWFRSRNLSTIVGNEAWNNIIGINDFGINHKVSRYPSKPGGAEDTPLDPMTTVPLKVSDNVAVANGSINRDYWGAPTYDDTNLITANSEMEVHAGISTPIRPRLINPQLVCRPGGQFGIFASVAYVFQLEVIGGYIGGCRFAMPDAGAIDRVIYDGTIMQNEKNFIVPDPPRRMDVKVHFKPLGNKPLSKFEFGKTHPVWDGTSPLPATAGVDPWVVYGQDGSRWTYTDLDSGKRYVLFVPQMRGSLPAWPSQPEKPNDQHISDCPEAGISNLECWNRYGMSWGGDVINDADIVPIDGLSIGLAREGDPTKLGPPRAIVTSPTIRHDASAAFRPMYGEQWLRIQVQLTGDDSRYHNAMARVDGGKWEVVPPSAGSFPSVRFFSVHGAALTPGVHTIETVRGDDKNATTSPMTFQYRIGDGESQLPGRGLR